MAIPSYVGAGAISIAGMATTLTPSYPSGLAANDLLILRVNHRNNLAAVDDTINVPGGWTSIYADQQNNCRQVLYYAFAAGTESGTISISRTGDGTVNWSAQIYAFRGVNTTTPFEAASREGAASSTVLNDVGVTTSGSDRLAVNFATHDGAPVNTLTVFTGQTGGTWVLQDAYNGNLPASCVQTANMASSGTIDGGGLTGLNAGVWNNRGFALAPSATPVVVHNPLRGAGVPGMAQHGMRGVW